MIDGENRKKDNENIHFSEVTWFRICAEISIMRIDVQKFTDTGIIDEVKLLPKMLSACQKFRRSETLISFFDGVWLHFRCMKIM